MTVVPSNNLVTDDFLSLDCNCPGPPPIFNIPAPPFPPFLEEECEEFETCDFLPAIPAPSGDNQLPTLAIILLSSLFFFVTVLITIIVLWRRKRRKSRGYLSGKSPPGGCSNGTEQHIRYNDLATTILDHRERNEISKEVMKVSNKEPFTFIVNPRLGFHDDASQNYNASQDSCNPVYEEISEGCESRPLSECESKSSLDSCKPSSSEGRRKSPRSRMSSCYDDEIPMVEKYDPELRRHKDSHNQREQYLESALSYCNLSPNPKQQKDLGEILDRLNTRMPPPVSSSRSGTYLPPYVSGNYRTERPSRRDRRPCPECQQGFWDSYIGWTRDKDSPRSVRPDDPRFSSLRSPKSKNRRPGHMAVMKNVPGDMMLSPYAYDPIDRHRFVHEDHPHMYPGQPNRGYPGPSMETPLSDPSIRPTHTSSSGGSRDSYGSDSGYTGSNTLSRQHSFGKKDPFRLSNRSSESGQSPRVHHCRGMGPLDTANRRRQRPCDHLSPTEDEPLYYPHMISR